MHLRSAVAVFVVDPKLPSHLRARVGRVPVRLAWGFVRAAVLYSLGRNLGKYHRVVRQEAAHWTPLVRPSL